MKRKSVLIEVFAITFIKVTCILNDGVPSHCFDKVGVNISIYGIMVLLFRVGFINFKGH